MATTITEQGTYQPFISHIRNAMSVRPTGKLGVTIMKILDTNASSVDTFYTVPSGKKLMITGMYVGAQTSSTGYSDFYDNIGDSKGGKDPFIIFKNLMSAQQMIYFDYPIEIENGITVGNSNASADFIHVFIEGYYV